MERITLLREPNTVVEDPLIEGDPLAESVACEPWRVLLYNDEVHLFDEVVIQVRKATGYSWAKAFEITLTAHITGLAVVYEGDIEQCLRVEAVLREIDLRTDIVR